MREETDYIDVFGIRLRRKEIWIIIGVVVVSYIVVMRYFTVPVPGNLLEKSVYDTKLYVNVFPDSNSVKNYRLVGDVSREMDCDDDGNNCFRWYQLTKFTFPNNGYIEFDDCQVYLNKKVSCTDYHSNDWDIELTNLPAK